MQNDLDKAMEFYKKLGIELTFNVPEKWAEFEVKGVKLGLAPTEQELPERHTGLVFETEDMDAFVQSLKKENIPFYKEPIEAMHGIMASIKDPGNNIIDIYQPTPEKVQEAMAKAAAEEEKK